jgi:HEAT repeat protein
LAAAESLGLLAEVESAVVALMADSDGFTRAEAARRLARVDTPSARAALEVASVDATPMVKEAALQALAGQVGEERAAPFTAPVNLDAPLDSQLPVEAAS